MPSLVQDIQDSQKAISRLVAKAWLDEDFKARLLAEPALVLIEHGIILPSGVEVKVNQNPTLANAIDGFSGEGNGVYEIFLPSKPAQLADIQLRAWVDGEGTEPPSGIVFTG